MTEATPTPTDTPSIVERVREDIARTIAHHVGDAFSSVHASCNPNNALWPDAFGPNEQACYRTLADRVLDVTKAEIERLQASLDRTMEALRPFADFIAQVDQDGGEERRDDHEDFYAMRLEKSEGSVRVSFGDLRKARDAVESK